MNILETHNLTKRFGNHKALQNVSLSLEEGGVYGLLGPNGAGKTTFLRVVNNILTFDGGEVLFKGKQLDRKTGRFLGYMAEERGLYPKMTVEDQILFFGQLRGGEPRRLRKVMEEYMDIFAMSRKDRKRQVKELSKGNQQKVQIIATLVHEPELVMLDEPFSGFDPINGVLLNSAIDRLKQNGTTIVLSSHNMAAVEEICTSIALINNGQLLLSGPLKDIKKRFRNNEYEVTASAAVDFSSSIEDNVIVSAELQNSSEKDRFTYKIKMGENVQRNRIIMDVCSQASLISYNEILPTLSELFIRFASGQEDPMHVESQTINFEKL